ncbi:MAG: GTPase Era [Anaerolineales bacterium]|nr:GTPase Era [Anaerolineales bacterium]
MLGTVIDEEELPEGHKSGFVALVGRPNVGKSTLMNAFMKQKIAIATPRAQTTRNNQLGILTQPDHQIVFVDTPGIMQKAMHKLDEVMLDTAVESLNDADVVVWLVDTTFAPNEDDARLAEMMSQSSGNLILALNKNDEVPPEEVLERIDSYRQLVPAETPWLFFSALRGAGVDELHQLIVDALPEGPRYYPQDQITDIYTRDLAAEMIREQVLMQIRDEIPHGVTVQVTSFKEDEKPLRINATIFVERDSHKRIIIGANGAQIKQIGTAARREISHLVGEAVYLDLWVKVAPKWRRDEAQLKRFGYLRE